MSRLTLGKFKLHITVSTDLFAERGTPLNLSRILALASSTAPGSRPHFQSTLAYFCCLNFLCWHCCLKQIDLYFAQVELPHTPYQANTIYKMRGKKYETLGTETLYRLILNLMLSPH